MRIDLPDELMENIRSHAQQNGRGIEETIADLLRTGLEQSSARRTPAPVARSTLQRRADVDVAGAVLVGAGGAGGRPCSIWYRFSIPFSCRLRISQRSSFDSLMPMRMSLIDSYTEGSLTIFPAVPCPAFTFATASLSCLTRPVNSASDWSA